MPAREPPLETRLERGWQVLPVLLHEGLLGGRLPLVDRAWQILWDLFDSERSQQVLHHGFDQHPLQLALVALLGEEAENLILDRRGDARGRRVEQQQVPPR